jgi:uncharacterized protein with NAD-binding domain and iron-sulfur cluster
MEASSSAKKKKIAVLGGGLGSLSAIYEMTDYPGWEKYYDITVYQMGWRLGGKTATGRGIHNRIEEKGIHIFQGWYDNAFRMVKDAYKLQDELGLNPNSPLKKWSEAIVPDNASLFTEYSEREGKWINWPIIFPMNDQEPGTAGKSTEWELIRKILGIALQLVVGDPYEKNQGFLDRYLMEHLLDVNQKFGDPQPKNKPKPHWWDKLIGGIKKTFQKKVVPIEVAMLHKAVEIAEAQMRKQTGKDPGEVEVEALEKVVHLFSGFTHWFEKAFSHAIEKHDRLRRIISVIEWMEVTLTGVLEDVYDPDTHTFNYQKINHYNYLDWLKKHGASDLVLDCALVRFMYTGSFANLLNGGTGKLAADIGLRMLMVSVDYKGCLVWKLTAGTADTIITPIYQVLRHRGVKFKYFHKIRQVHHSESGKIEKISVAEQIKLRDGVDEYDPFLNVGGLNSWPAEPLYDQIDPDQAKKLKENDVNLEISWSDWENYRELTLEEGKDFDQVLLGIPVAALKHVCSDIIEHNSQWKKMVEKVETTQTAQVQVWTKPTLRELGMKVEDWGMAEGDEPNSVIYANYLYSWTDMSLIIDAEEWPESLKPGHLSYWCGTIPEASPMEPFSKHWFPKTQQARIMGITEQWLYSHGGWLWPEATSRELPQGFNFDLMTPTEENNELTPIKKFYQQFFLLNIEPSDRYVLALPGSNQYRMKTDGSGYSNLFLTGDWIDFGFNVGHMEGAVTAGLTAAHAIRKSHGLNTHKEIF